jgi:ribosomal protein L4
MPQSTSPGMLEPVNVRIPNLRREDAIKAKNILKGVLVAKAEEIDIAKLSPQEIEEVLHKFGESVGVI